MTETKVTKVEIYTDIRDFLAENECPPEWINRINKDITKTTVKKVTYLELVNDTEETTD